MNKIKSAFTMALLAALSGCAASPHALDVGSSVAVIATGGTEMNPVSFPAKVVGEAVGYATHGTETCHQIVWATRLGSCIGSGATIGGLAGGPVGMAVGGLAGAVGCYSWTGETAQASCYAAEEIAYPEEETARGWGNMNDDSEINALL